MTPPTADPLVEPTGSRFSAAIYDPFLWVGERLGMSRRRTELLSNARGRVLEIGAGTGLNLRHYPDSVEELVLAEPAEPMAARLERRRSRAGRAARVVQAPAEELPFQDDSFDTVVSTLVLCTVVDPARALGEIQRVLKPGGRLLFCEHIRSDSARLSRWQDRLAEPWSAFAEGCRCNRETLSLISERMEVTEHEHGRWRGMPAIVKPLVTGEAVPTRASRDRDR